MTLLCKQNIFFEKNKKNFKKGIKYLKITPIYITSKSKVILLGEISDAYGLVSLEN